MSYNVTQCYTNVNATNQLAASVYNVIQRHTMLHNLKATNRSPASGGARELCDASAAEAEAEASASGRQPSPALLAITPSLSRDSPARPARRRSMSCGAFLICLKGTLGRSNDSERRRNASRREEWNGQGEAAGVVWYDIWHDMIWYDMA